MSTAASTDRHGSAHRRCAAVLLLVVVASGLPGCQAAKMFELFLQEQTYSEDRRLEAEIEGALMFDPLLDGAPIEARVFRRELLLVGDATPAQRARALVVAEQVGGFEAIRTDWERSAVQGSPWR